MSPTLTRTALLAESPPTSPSLSVVIVNYNGWADVVRLVEALAGSSEVASGRCELIVVDNGSDDPAPSELTRPRVGLRLVERGENGGFAAGVNAGWRASRGRWLLLLNPDVVAGPDLPGSILARLRSLEARGVEAPGVVGFGLRNPDGTRQGSVGAEPGLARAIVEPLLPRSRRKYKVGWRAKAGPVPWVTGACALVDRRLLEALGGMDEDFFLYYEEVALCRAARNLGRAVEFDPTVEVVHERPLASRSVSPRMRVITRHSKLLYFRKHRPHWEFVAMSWLVQAEAACRSCLARARGRGDVLGAWKAVGRLAAMMRRGGGIVGRQVPALADSAVAGRLRVDRAEASRPLGLG